MSIYQLINKLCIELIRDCDCYELDIQSAKKIAFEALLKRSLDCENCNETEKTINEFQFTQFELSLHNKTKEIDKIDQYIDLLKENPSELLSISTLLVSLKNIDPNEINEPHSFLQLQTKVLQDVKKNNYLSHISLSSDHVQKASNDGTNFLSSILEAYIGRKEKSIENLKLKVPEKQNQMIISGSSEKVTENSVSIASSISSHKKTFTWENLDDSDSDSLPKEFSTESSNPFIYQRLKLSSRSSCTAEITIVPFPKLLNDIKLLMIGIESETFKRTESLKFHVTTNVCCENIADLDIMLDKFLEMGTCFTRLKSYTAKNPFNQNQIFEGFIFKSFCDRVIKFLNYSRDIIYSQEAETFLELYNNTSKITKIIIHLSKFLHIHPLSLTIQRTIPNGSEFLRLLYNEYTFVLDNNVKCFYVDMLKTCCDVYYVRYQEWLYHGKLEDPYKELFIYFVDRYKENTKHFFDRAYLIRRQSVPDFLTSCADNVLLCGKYTILLKSFNPMHPLFLIAKPSFKICLTYEQVNDLKEHCRKFIARARDECGDPISISEILEEKRRKKLEKYKNAEIASTKNAQKWKQFQEERLQEIREFREAQQKELCKELELIEEKKMLKRMSEIQYERDYMDEMEMIEDEELRKENEMLKSRVKIYQELNNKLSDELENNKFSTKESDANANSQVVDNQVIKDAMNNILDTKQSLTEAQRNRIKVMSHEYNFSGINDGINNNKTEIVTEQSKSLSDAQKNKLKILGHEFGMIDQDSDTIQRPEIKIEKDFDKMTDLQKNRLKVLSHEYNLDEDRNEKTKMFQRRPVSRENMTALQRNRQKVMSHEFGFDEIVSEKKQPESLSRIKKLSLDLLNPVVSTTKQLLESPMSTTSDHFNSETNESLEKSSTSDTSQNFQNSKKEMECNKADDEDKLEMIKEFQEAIERNQINFMELKLRSGSEKSLLVSSPQPSEMLLQMDTTALAQYLQMSLTLPLNAYMDILNNETLKMYVKDLDILSHFKSLRNYFLLMNGEFCSCICHEIFSKIESGMRPNELLNYQSLHMVLDHALSNSRCYDSNTDNLSFIVQNIPEKFELHSPSILNMLTLSYQLDWPLSLILSPETMDKYRAIFNYLIKLKRITWILEQCFQILKESHKQHGIEILKSEQYRNVQHIRHKMTQFVNCLENYVTRNVIQISWNGFIEDIKSAESILCIYRKHANYLKRILFLCLLNKSYTDFYKNIEDIFKVILKFYKHLKSGKWQFSSATYGHEKYNKMQIDADEFHRLIRYILYLGNKVIQQGYQKEIYDLLHLIDVNGYYSSSD